MLDDLPLQLLLALRDAVADPSEEGRRRAEQRAADAGFYLKGPEQVPNVGIPRVLHEPLEMEPAPEGVVALALDFSRRTPR